MTPEEFDALFDRFQRTAFRLEALPDYAYTTDVEAFLAGRPRPERSVRTSPWMARLATSTVDGRRWSRVRVIDDPLTDYQRYELDTYRESQAAGESISIADRSQVGDLPPDFWLFDENTPAQCAVVLHYDDAGAVSREEFLDAAEVDRRRLLQARKEAEAAAVPLNAFLARVGGV